MTKEQGNKIVEALITEVSNSKSDLSNFKILDSSISSIYASYTHPLGIAKVAIYPNKEYPKTVVVTFADGRTERATASFGDVFEIETGITICIAKHLITLTCGGNSTAKLGNAVRRGLKIYSKGLVEQQKALELAEIKKQRAKRKHDKRMAKKAKAREEAIEIQKEAYIRAMKEIGYASLYNPDALNESK